MSVTSIRVTPNVGEFSDVEAGMIFVIPFTIHNVSTSVKRVRFAPPKTSMFRLINAQQSIAPGMKQVVEVEFTSKEAREIHDSFSVRTEEGEIVVPLHAWFPAPNIVCDGLIDLGRVSVQHPVESKVFKMRNAGKRDGIFKFVEDVPIAGLSAVPSTGLVPAGKSLDILIHYFPSETGSFRGNFSLHVEGLQPRVIETCAEVVESRVAVLDALTKDSLAHLSFGKLYFGQSREVDIVVKNFSEHTVSFTIRPQDEQSADNDASAKSLLPFECFPREGRIGEGSESLVKIRFKPEMTEQKRGWEHSTVVMEDLAKSWEIPFVVEVVETEQRIDLALSGKATPTLVALSESHFRFPDCNVNDHCDILFSLTNNNPELPSSFEFSRIAHFRLEPSQGKIPPRGKQDVLVTFMPNQLGSFDGRVMLTLNQGVKKIPMLLSGTSSAVDPRPPRLGGIDKVKDDFARPAKFARTASQSAPQVANRRENEAASPVLASQFLLMSEWEQKREHNRLYNNFVANARNVRQYNEKVKAGMTHDTNPDDIGMVPGEGLDEPEPTISTKVDRLAWAPQSEQRNNGDGPSMRKALRVDENKVIKKKFRREPGNLNEMRECKLELSPTDIQSIVTPVKVLDFQQVSVFSKNTKSFFVFNGLKTHIIVHVPFQREELALSTPPSQVIPPGQIAGFDITFRSETVQTFQQAVYFTINETHKLKFVVFAEVIPIDVGLSQKEMNFRFADFGSDPSVTLPVVLTNNGNSDAEFQWGFTSENDGTFSFNPATGFVPASGSMSVNVTYTPTVASMNEASVEALLRVKGSATTKKLMLNGTVTPSTCTWSVKDGRLDFKKLPVGSVRSQNITIRNTGTSSSVFAFDTTSLPSAVSIYPLRGRVAAGSSEDVQITLRAASAQSFKCNLSCHIRGMRQLLKAMFTAEVKVPDFSIVEPVVSRESESEEDASGHIDFGGVYVGSYEPRRIQMHNNDDVPVFFKIDLSSFPMFSLFDQEKRPVDAIVSDSDDLAINVVGQVAHYRSRADDDEDTMDTHRNVFRVAINPHQTFHFYLVFTPSHIGRVEPFVLPISFAGSDAMSDALFPIVVAGEGRKPRLVLTPSIVDFGSRVVSRENTSKIPNRILVKLTNETDSDLPWDLQMRQPNDSQGDIFRVEPTSGRLPPGQSSQVQFTFTPPDVKAFAARYSIFLDGNKEVKYMDIVAKGFGANPLLTFDRKELILPSVPLEVTAKTTFYVANDGYESLDLRYKIAGEGKLPISLHFPDGQTITSNHNVLPVEVSFCSKKPMTFTVNIDFYDDVDSIFSIPITCTADNSLLTTFGYLKYREGAFTVTAENDKKPLQYAETEDVVEKESTPRHSRDGSSATGGDDNAGGSFQTVDQVLKKSLTKRSIDRLRNWLNNNLLQEPVDDLLGTLQQGKLASDIVELLFGKAPPSATQPAAAKQGVQERVGKKDTASTQQNALTEPFDALLLFLKQYGACVSEIRAEYLLRFEDYSKAPAENNTKNKGTVAKVPKLNERRFAQRSLHAWSVVLFQILRVFYVSRVTFKMMKSLPLSAALQQCASTEKWSSLTAEPSTNGSNLYSTSEAVLLKWLSVHNTAVFGTKSVDRKKGSPDSAVGPRITNFESDVRDCRAYAACVQSYIPSLAARFDTTKENGFCASPTSTSELERNATVLLDAMRDYGLDVRINGREFLEYGGRDHLLFTSYLFNALPQYIPKTSIRFKGKLLEKISKQVEISNPTKWPVDYVVSLDGSDEFKLMDTKLRLEPKSSAMFTITVTPRFAKKIESRILFISSRGGAFYAATMVFNLETEVETDSAIKVIDNIEAPMYELQNTEIQVENPFGLNGQFNVQLQQEYVKAGYPEEASLGQFPDAFWSATDTLAIKKNDRAKFPLQFLPCVRGQYRARIIFRDDKVGEFAYQIIATCLPPKPQDSLSIQTEATTVVNREVTLPYRNAALERAMLQKDERFKIFKGTRKAQPQKEQDNDTKEVVYKLDFVNDKFVGPNPFFNGPKSFALRAGDREKEDDDAQRRRNKNEKGAAPGQTLNVGFCPKGPGTYNGFLILTSSWDVRVIAIEGKSRSPGMKAELDFNCPARQQIAQEIPITNNSEKEWVVSAQLTGENFSGPREVRVPPGRTKSYNLLFNPMWMCDVTGQLVLRNNETQEKYTYTLKGKAEEPLAENTIPVECRAREARKITINVPNITFDEVTYAIETDLPFVKGDPRITVAKMEVGKYVLTINPQVSGKTTGSITFVAPNKQYVWFVLQLTVSRPPPEETVTIEAEVRKGAVAEMTITNPTNKVVDFTVRRKGDGLFGDDLLTLEPYQSEVYQLAFAPVKSVTSEGIISFNNDDIGEFWYRLNLIGKEAAPQLLSFQCELGKKTSQEVVIQNPLDTECLMMTQISNDTNFAVAPQSVLLRPNAATKVTISYIPSTMQSGQEAVIKLFHNAAGTWEFRCKGTGLPPTKMEALQCTSQVGRMASLTINFRNPFPTPTRFSMSLQQKGTAFSLAQRKPNFALGPFQTMQITISYNPTTIASHKASLVVNLQEQPDTELVWEYPINGTAESVSNDPPSKLTCKSRKQLLQTIPLTLDGYDGDVNEEEFDTELLVPADFQFERAARNSVHYERTASNQPKQLSFEFRFAPLRPFVTSAEFLVKKRTGGVWRFPLLLEATTPEADDTLVIEAAVSATASVSFQLYNVLPQTSNYVAYFTPESPQEFAVNPAKGQLPAMPSPNQPTRGAGATISVQFTSSQYGKTLVGTLLVDTEEMQWRFEVRGTLPRYQPPTSVASKVSNRLRPETETAIKRKK